jgi:two-component sensor histidine kinase
LNKTKHQSLLDRFQDSQNRIKALKANRETLLEELQTLANNFALADAGE